MAKSYGPQVGKALFVHQNNPIIIAEIFHHNYQRKPMLYYYHLRKHKFLVFSGVLRDRKRLSNVSTVYQNTVEPHCITRTKIH